MAWETPSGNTYVGKSPPLGSQEKGILYPRSGTLGGCTAHNALVNIYPHEKDWDNIASITGDRSWSASNMRRIYEKLEKVDYIRVGNPGHGFNGWLGVGRADVTLALNDTKLLAMGLNTASKMGQGGPLVSIAEGAVNLGRILAGDANSGSAGRDQTEGVYNIPLAEYNYKRNGAREFVMQVYNEKTILGAKRYSLDIMTDTLVTKVLFSDGVRPKASGVQFLKGKSLYRADPRSSRASTGTPGHAFATREVILSGGAFNTPQLLKLSGIGPRDELSKFNIPVKVDLPGVGTNLQDHFEIGVTHQTRDSFAVVEHCTYGKLPDACLDNWKNGKGPYASSNGFIFAIIKKSTIAKQDTVFGNDPDLLIFGGIADFKGYYPGYSSDVYGYRNWTWVVLKAHTGNYGAKAGTVKLVSSDPRDMPDINFHYFDAGSTENNAHERDLQAMAEGVALSRNISDSTSVPFSTGKDFVEVLPGKHIDSDAALKNHIKAEAWSHHASCTCPIGANDDHTAVLDSKFRVRGVEALRVVDASVFPRIPGFFIAVPTYMVGEKAAETILSGE
jgi:choline dehydrogenase